MVNREAFLRNFSSSINSEIRMSVLYLFIVKMHHLNNRLLRGQFFWPLRQTRRNFPKLHFFTDFTPLLWNIWIMFTLRYIWTGGRKCNFRGCDRADLSPNIINGWFWAARRTKIPAKQDCDFCEWSPTGG